MKIYINGQVIEIGELSTVADAVKTLGVEDSRGVAVAVDGEVVPASRWGTVLLSEGREVEILRAVQGGA